MEHGTLDCPANIEETLNFMSSVTEFKKHYFTLHEKVEDVRSNVRSKFRNNNKVYNIRVMDEWGMVHEFYDEKAGKNHWYYERGIKPVAFIVKVDRKLDDYGVRFQQTNKTIKRYDKSWYWKEQIWHLPDHDFYFTKE
jgi:hypothetical protein